MKKLLLWSMLLLLLAAPVLAWDCPCNSYCNYQSGMCTQGAEGTCSYQACVQETFGCHDSMCLGPSRGSDFLSAETTKKPVEAPTCTPTKGGDAG